MDNFVVGMIGAIAPEIIRWRRISRRERLDSLRLDYVLPTIAYVLLAGFIASLIAQPTPWAAFTTGLTAEYAVAGAMRNSPRDAGGPEEVESGRGTRLGVIVASLRRHAAYLTDG